MNKTAIRLAFLTIILFHFPAGVLGADHSAFADKIRQSASEALDAETLAALSETAAALPDAVSLEGLGHGLLMQRHFDEAAYFFASAVAADPNRPSALTALGVIAMEAAPADASRDYYDAIVALQRDAAAALPEEGMVLLNLGTALLRAGQAADDEALIREAVTVLEQALEKEYMTEYASLRLAEARAALGDKDGAAEALSGAFFRNPYSLGLSQARIGPLADIPVSGGERCEYVNYGCAFTCPPSIIGQIDRVTCEIAEASARSACSAGEPFSMWYDCSTQMPEFGIIIPGLFSGFSIVTPWGSIDLLVQGNGRVDFKAKALGRELSRVQPFLDVQGSYDPRRERALVWDTGTGMQFALFNKNPVMREVNSYDVGPSAVVRLDIGAEEKAEARLEAGRGVLLAQ